MTGARIIQPLADRVARDRILTEFDRTFFVEAGAGTGKTTATVARIVNLVAASKLTIDRLAAITFTEAAAAELRDRVREALERASGDERRLQHEQRRCRQAVEDIDAASISTIHAFAGQLLRTFPLEAGLPPGFATLDEIQQSLQFEERFKLLFWRDALHEPLRACVKRALLLGMTQENLARLAAALDGKHDLLGPNTTWEAPEPPSAMTVAAFAARKLSHLLRSVPYAFDGEQDPLVRIVRSAQSSARQLFAARTEDEALSALLSMGRLRAAGPNPSRWKNALDGRNAGLVVYETLQDVHDRAFRTLDAHRSLALAAVLTFLRDFVLAGVLQRRAAGVATFHDLLTWARDLLRDNASVRHAAQARYQRIFIDEFQDTDPLQAEIAFYLAADEGNGCALPADWRDTTLVPGKLFVVGDPKQSIYRFRGADITIYDDLLHRLSDTREQLTHNFRSVRPVLDWVNHHFVDHMTAEKGIQPPYVPLDAQWPAHDGAECGVRRVGGLLDGTAADAADGEARALAALARSAVEGAWRVSDFDALGDRVPRQAAYRDICILLPARTHLRRLERALERAEVPYRVEAGKLVLATQEVRDLLSCLRAIEDPSDQVALVAALRSPAYACSDVDLLRWVEGGGELDHEHPGDGPDGPVRVALASLAAFHRRRLLQSPPALIESFLAERLLMASAFGEVRPREVWRRLRYVVSRARAFTSTGRLTLRAFVDWIEGLQHAEVRDPEVGSAESDEDAVHIQTVHRAKGLEFPIVLLGGLGSAGRGRLGSIEVIADLRAGRLACRAGLGWETSDFASAWRCEKRMLNAEAIRLLYVGATRAKDHLVLSLFRGARAEDTAAAAIERRLNDGPPEMCPEVPLPEYDELEPAESSTAAGVDTADHLEAERTWASQRSQLLEAAAAPRAHQLWWSSDGHTAALATADDAVSARRNVSLLARVEEVLLEENVDLMCRSRDGYLLLLGGTDDADSDQLRAGRVALAFAASTGSEPSGLEVVAADGSTIRPDLAVVTELARVELRRVGAPSASATT